MNIDLVFNNETKRKKYDEKYFVEVAKTVLKHLKIKNDIILELSIIDNKKIHEINKEYRNVDRETDVISFAFEDDVEGEVKIIYEDDMPRDLGAIYISMDKAISQAKEYNHTLKREITFLFVHGLLHLLGYDHMKESDEKVMFGLQDEIMTKLKLDNEALFNYERMIKEAKKATKSSYSPYSKYPVGAALLTIDNEIILGANIENCAYPDTICAERVAMFSGHMKGLRKEDYVSLAIYSNGKDFPYPCGSCRQVMSELLPKDVKIIVATEKEYKVYSQLDLLPEQFVL